MRAGLFVLVDVNAYCTEVVQVMKHTQQHRLAENRRHQSWHNSFKDAQSKSHHKAPMMKHQQRQPNSERGLDDQNPKKKFQVFKSNIRTFTFMFLCSFHPITLNNLAYLMFH